jgi:uncharacterized Rossmann fold enzyme
MEFGTWEPVYEAMLEAFGFGREGDERARDRLEGLLAGRSRDPATLPVEGTVAVVGPVDPLSEAASIREADTVLGVSTGAAVLVAGDIDIDLVVTDLDGDPEAVRALADRDTPVVVHAHGDNRERLETVVPDLPTGQVVPTTQARPTERVYNFGGFTDGDRAAFLADALGADRLLFPGWALDSPAVSPQKARKLRWAQRLLYWLERRREDRFDLLDGRRETLSLPPGVG